jgi:MFS family permease
MSYRAVDRRSRMTPVERRATACLAGVSALRMLGLFVVLPVLALYAATLPGGADPRAVGLALGAYGLAQAILQVPFGWASDRFGRKRAIAAGLVVFAAGSFLAAAATDAVWLIAGRALQGGGAVSAAVMALAADLTRDEVRTRAMAGIGIAIGSTFALSLVLAAPLAAAIGVPGIFVLTGVLALSAIAVIARGVPEAPLPVTRRERGFPRAAIADPQLLRLDFGIFALHAILMALFVEVPFALRDAGLAPASHWQVYLPVLVASVVVVLPLFRVADRRGPRQARADRGDRDARRRDGRSSRSPAARSSDRRGAVRVLLRVHAARGVAAVAGVALRAARRRAARRSACSARCSTSACSRAAPRAACCSSTRAAGRVRRGRGAGADLARGSATMGEPPAAAESSLSMGRT